MNPPDATPRVLLPKPTSAQIRPLPLNSERLPSSFAGPAIGIQLNARQPKSATRTEQEWEDQKPNFLRLFVDQNLPLEDVIQKMDEEHDFKASRKQYNTRIALWRVGKNIKDNEMRAIVRKETRRKKENPPKDSVFRVRKYPVNPQKIARFKRDKGFEDDDIIMMDAGTPSDISCDTPQLETRALSVQEPRMTPENDTIHLLRRTVQPMSLFDSYLSALRLNMASDRPYLYQIPPSQSFATKSPNLGQLRHAPQVNHSSSSPARSHRSHKESIHSCPHGYHGSLSHIASNSPPIKWTDFGQHILGSTHSDKSIDRPSDGFAQSPLNTVEPDISRFEWYESLINFGRPARSPPNTNFGSQLGKLLRTFVHGLNTFEARKKYELLQLSWSMIRQIYGPEFSLDNCQMCRAWIAVVIFEKHLHSYYTCPSDDWVHSADLAFVASETLQGFIPVLECEVEDVMDIAASAARILLEEKRYQDVQRIIEASLHEMKFQQGWSILRKSVSSFFLADFYIGCGRHDRAREIVQNILGEEYAVVTTVAAAVTEVDFTTEDILNGGCPLPTSGLDYGDLSCFKLTYEGLEAVREYMGEERTNHDLVYICAILVLRRLNETQLIDVTE
ncbi:hypothetical protein MMC11_001605 [Xylographa trunciseda]|nr:hypothetical protein [Xylographa trunciseda]